MSVRVRFAPSPTGYLHVGGLRTALYNYLFAKHNHGEFILRIEDTDRTRFVENAMENLIETLCWSGIDYDEGPDKGGNCGPYIQSQRLDIYKQYANILLNNSMAYYAFDTPEEIEAMRSRLKESGKEQKYDRASMRNQLTLPEAEVKTLIGNNTPFVIRLKIPDTEIRFKDIIRGEVTVHGKDIDDQVLLKSDGFPTYHLANVVDDYLMKITHVIRGEEWLPSTPKHIILYQAFGWQCPQFAHLPLLLNKDKSKLSKRQGDVAVEDYRAKGYSKEALINFVALLGWNPTADREIYDINELIEHFNLEKVNKGGAVFDIQKLEWMNAQYLRNQSHSELALELKNILDNTTTFNTSLQYCEKIIPLFIERVNFIKDIPIIAKYMFIEPIDFELEYLKKHWKVSTLEFIMPLFDLIKNTDDFSHNSLHDLVKNYVENNNLKLKDVIHPLRLMITGQSTGAGMFETMEVIGKDNCIIRMSKFIEEKKYEIS